MQTSAELAVGEYGNVLIPTYNNRMASKMGMQEYNRDLSVGLLTAMYEDKADFTNSFRALEDVSVSDPAVSMPESLRAVSADSSASRHDALTSQFMHVFHGG